MLRQHAQPRTTFASPSGGASGQPAPVRHGAARVGVAMLRLIVAPFAAIAAALAGLVFAVLLPICGIATISEGIARASWRFLRTTIEQLPHAPTRRI